MLRVVVCRWNRPVASSQLTAHMSADRRLKRRMEKGGSLPQCSRLRYSVAISMCSRGSPDSSGV